LKLVEEETARRASHKGHTVIQQEIGADYERTQKAVTELQSELAVQRASHDAYVFEHDRLLEKSAALSPSRAVRGCAVRGFEHGRVQEPAKKLTAMRVNDANSMPGLEEVAAKLGRSETPAHSTTQHMLAQPTTSQESTDQPHSHQSLADAPHPSQPHLAVLGQTSAHNEPGPEPPRTPRDGPRTIATIARLNTRLRKGGGIARRLANKHGIAQARKIQADLESFVEARANLPGKDPFEVGHGSPRGRGSEFWCNNAQECSDN